MKFFKDIFRNPDGTYSTKRTFSFISLVVSIVVGFIGMYSPHINETTFAIVFGGFMSGWLGTLGISAFDTKNYYQNGGVNALANQPINIPSNGTNSQPPAIQ